MLAEDHATWTGFLSRFPNEFEEIWYDVHVGQAMPVPEGSPDYLRSVAAGVSRKRIDVIARRGKVTYIIEVKKHANMESIGQVITYWDLFLKEFEFPGQVRGMIIATTADADIGVTASRQGVGVVSLEGVTP